VTARRAMVEWRRCGRRVGGRARGRLPGAILRSAEVVGNAPQKSWAAPALALAAAAPALDHHAARRHGSRSPTPNCAKVLRTLAWLRPHAMYTNSSNAPFIYSHPSTFTTPPTFDCGHTHVPSSSTPSPHPSHVQHRPHFRCGDSTPSTSMTAPPPSTRPSRRSPSNQLQHPLPEQPLLKPAAGPA
jgi:hypothetical protein